MNEDGWPVLVIPFLIVSLWILVGGIGLVFLAVKGFQLPNYFNSSNSSNKSTQTIESDEADDFTMTKWRGYLLLILTFLFYFLFCGFDLMFQSKLYTFALCGPLGLYLLLSHLSQKVSFRVSSSNWLNLNILKSKPFGFLLTHDSMTEILSLQRFEQMTAQLFNVDYRNVLLSED